MSKHKPLSKGDRVEVKLIGIHEPWLMDEMKQYHGWQTTVTRVVHCGTGCAYELDNINGKSGKPYLWMREALKEVK